MKTSSPPKLFLKFLRWFCHPKLLKYIEGDLIELYHQRIEELGKQKADRKFIGDVLLLFRPGIIKPLEQSPTINIHAMLKNYFKIGWRNLVRNKGFSFINIGGLAFGITVSLIIGLWIYNELSFDWDNKHKDRIARVIQNVTNNGEVQTWKGVPFPLAEELRNNYSSDFKHIAMAINWGEHMLTLKDKTLKQVGVYIEKDGPKILDLKMMMGSSDMVDPSSILLSASTAQIYFGNEDPINQMIQIDEQALVKVIGVYHDFPDNSTFAGLNFISSWEFLYNTESWFKTVEDPWRPNFAILFVELNDNIEFSVVSAKIKDAKLKKINPQLAQKKPELFLHPMNDWHLRSEFKNGVNAGGAIQYVWMFGMIGGFVLLLACINFMNLSTARHEIRAKEVGIRKTIGSLRKQLVLQFFSESFLIVLFSFAISLLLAQLVIPFFSEVANNQIFILWKHPLFWLMSLGFIVITSLVAGSYPAFYLSSFKPIQVLKGTFKAGKSATLPRKILVISQFSISITLIIGTIIVYQQIQFAKNRPVGYSRGNLLSIPTMNSSIHKHFDAVKEELTQTGMISSVAESQSALTSIWGSTSGFSWSGKDPNLSIDFGTIFSSHDYGKTIDWKIKEGRDFSREFSTDSSAVILNEAAINFMGLKNPIGQEVTWWQQPFTIIGVIDNMVMESPYDEQKPVIYFLTSEPGNLSLVKLKPSVNASEAIAKIEPIFKKYNPGQPFEFQFVDEEYSKKFSTEERIGKLAGFFAMLAVTICCLGIFGLASFTVEQRTKEICIRKILGASASKLWLILSTDFIVLVIISCLIATPVSYYFLHQWLLKYEYRTNIDWWVFVAAGSGALIITLLTISYQSIKATMANPVKSLRSE